MVVVAYLGNWFLVALVRVACENTYDMGCNQLKQVAYQSLRQLEFCMREHWLAIYYVSWPILTSDC